MRKIPGPTPTNKPNTCLFCGKKLSRAMAWASRIWIGFDDATPKQLETWPLIHWYEYRHDEGETVRV